MKDIRTNFGESYYSHLHDLSESLISTLKHFGCEEVYGVGGDYAANLLKAFEDEFSMYPSSNEMHASFSACATAEIKDLSCCLTTYTVGSLPCVSGAALAKVEGLPVVFISGAPGECEVDNGPLHHSIYSSTDSIVEYNGALNAFKALGLKAERLQGNRDDGRPSVASEQFYRLVEYAYVNKEPVFIEIPRDLVFKKVQSLNLAQSNKGVTSNQLLLSGAEYIAQEITTKLREAKRPILYIGEKIKFNKDLLVDVQNFCERFNIPYTTNILAKGLMDESHELSLGMYNGIFSSERTRKYVEKDADYILEICTGIITQDTSSAFATCETHLNLFENKTTLKGSSVQCVDVHEVFKFLEIIELEKFNFNPPLKKKICLVSDQPVNFSNIGDILNRQQSLCSDSFVYLPEVGNSFFSSLHLEVKKSSFIRSWIANPWYAAMGTSIPYARSVCNIIKRNKYKDIPVILMGDGGFHFQLNELIHFLREDLFVIIILMRNDIFHLGKGSNCDMYSCSDTRFDFSKLISAYGGDAMVANTIEEFDKNFKSCLSRRKGIKFIEVPVGIAEDEQSDEIKLLNLYIKSKSGDPESIKKWSELV